MRLDTTTGEDIFRTPAHSHGCSAVARRFLPDLIWNQKINPRKVVDSTSLRRGPPKSQRVIDERRAIKVYSALNATSRAPNCGAPTFTRGQVRGHYQDPLIWIMLHRLLERLRDLSSTGLAGGEAIGEEFELEDDLYVVDAIVDAIVSSSAVDGVPA